MSIHAGSAARDIFRRLSQLMLFLVLGTACSESAEAPPKTSNGARYDFALGRWFPLPTEGAPSARLDHQAIWAGSEMIIWGGIDGGLGGRFLP